MKKLLLLLGLLTTLPAVAADYYVRTDGNDSNTGTANTAGGAWASLKKCAQTLTAGNRCLVQPGTYTNEGLALWAQANAGALESNNVRSNCTCTAGSTTITCGTSIPATVTAGDYVQCDTGTGFSWTRVASVSGLTITLDEGYRGATSTTAGADTLDVANFIEFIGDGALGSVTISNWYDDPGVTWAKEAGYSCVYSYTPGSVAGTTAQARAWQAKWCNTGASWVTPCSSDADCGGGANSCRLFPKGVRDSSTANKWDTYMMGVANGRDPFYRLSQSDQDYDYSGAANFSEACPCGDVADGQNKLTNVDSLPGSFAYDTSGATPKVYVSMRRTCAGGTRVGYTCYADADCPSSTCSACPSPSGLQIATSATILESGNPTSPFAFEKAYTMVRNLIFEAGMWYANGNGTPDSRALTIGAANTAFIDVTANSGVVAFSLFSAGSPNNDLLFQRVKAMQGSRCTAATTAGLSGVLFDQIEIRGTTNTTFNCGNLYGAAADDPIRIERSYFHRNFRGMGSPTCGSPADRNTWNCSTKYFDSETYKWTNGHGVFWGNELVSAPLCNTSWKNNIFEQIAGIADNDSLQLAGSTNGASCTGNTVAYNTFVVNQTLNSAHGIKAGTASSSAALTAYGNAFITQWSAAASSAVIYRTASMPASDVTADYNAYIYPAFDANGGSPTQASIRIWGSAETLAYVKANYSKETHSKQTCLDGCVVDANHIKTTNSQVTDAWIYDFTPSNLTPTVSSILVDAGAPAGIFPCPTVDFYGNPRSDGDCDVGAVEYQGAGGPTCGDGTRNGSEECDGTDFGSDTCVTLGFGSGSLSCTGSCTISTAGCAVPGVSAIYLRGATLRGGRLGNLPASTYSPTDTFATTTVTCNNCGLQLNTDIALPTPLSGTHSGLLYINCTGTSSANGINDAAATASCEYSINGGSSWTTAYTVPAPPGGTSSTTVSIPFTGLDLTLLRVRAYVDASSFSLGNITTATATVNNWWVEY